MSSQISIALIQCSEGSEHSLLNAPYFSGKAPARVRGLVADLFVDTALVLGSATCWPLAAKSLRIAIEICLGGDIPAWATERAPQVLAAGDTPRFGPDLDRLYAAEGAVRGNPWARCMYLLSGVECTLRGYGEHIPGRKEQVVSWFARYDRIIPGCSDAVRCGMDIGRSGFRAPLAELSRALHTLVDHCHELPATPPGVPRLLLISLVLVVDQIAPTLVPHAAHNGIHMQAINDEASIMAAHLAQEVPSRVRMIRRLRVAQPEDTYM